MTVQTRLMINERQSHGWHFLGNLAEEAIDVHDLDAFFSFLVKLSKQRSDIFVAQTRVDFADQSLEALKIDLLLLDALKDG